MGSSAGFVGSMAAGGRGLQSVWLGSRTCSRCEVQNSTPNRAVLAMVAGGEGKKYKTQRSMLSADKRNVSVDEINALFLKNGKPSRDSQKMQLALKHSFCVVSARLVGSGTLVAFARACSDEALNATIWDVLIDPELPDETLMKSNLLKFMLRELRREIPGCSVALFSGEGQIPFFQQLDFVADPDGIRGMILEQDNWDQAT